jgi:hypothetical protein
MNRNLPAAVVLFAVLGLLILPRPTTAAPTKPSEPFLAVYIHFPWLFEAKASPADRERAIARELDRIKACGLNTLLPYATGTAELARVWLPEGLERKSPQAGVATPQIYTHVRQKTGLGVRSPLDS